MPRPELLPGVKRTRIRPAMVVRSRSIITRARLRATVHDGAQLLLLGAVDWFFAHWDPARFPMLDRTESLQFLLVVNAAALTHLVMRRIGPRLRANQIARTWSRNEQQRYEASAVSRPSRLITKR